MNVARASRTRLPADWPLWATLLAAEVVAVATYALTVGGVSEPRYVVYPFVWINLGLYAVVRARSPEAPARRRALAAGAAALYGLVLAVVTGLIGVPLVEHGHVHGHPDGWMVSLSAPGWGPRVAYVVGDYHLYFVPYRVVGYAALSYLLYVGLAELSLATGAGVVGLLSCIGCALPLLAWVTVGAGAASLSAVGGFSLDASTAAFVAALGLLWWPQRDRG